MDAAATNKRPSARIYQRMKNAMQSGRYRVGQWVLEFETDDRLRADPLMGWTGSGDTRRQIRLTFPTIEAAKAYAEQQGLACHVIPLGERTLKLQSYADNFK